MRADLKGFFQESGEDTSMPPRLFPKNCTLRERGAKGKFVVQRGLTGTIFLPKRKKADFPKKYTLLDNIDAGFANPSGFPVKGA